MNYTSLLNSQCTIFTMKTCPPNLSIFLEQFHQHSSLPPVVIPHLGWDWRVLRLLLSVNIGTSEKMNTWRNRCVQNAIKALPRMNIGLVKMLISLCSNLSGKVISRSRSGSTIHRLWNYSNCFKDCRSNIWYNSCSKKNYPQGHFWVFEPVLEWIVNFGTNQIPNTYSIVKIEQIEYQIV